MRQQSFADLERGLGERAPLARDLAISPGAPSPVPMLKTAYMSERRPSESDLEFNRLSRVVSINIHKINANVAAISKFIELLGTPRDNPDLRQKLCVPFSLLRAASLFPEKSMARCGGQVLLTLPPAHDLHGEQAQLDRSHTGCRQGLDV